MFHYKYRPLDKEPSVVNYKGVFLKQIGLFEAVALILSATIGAGVLGIPYTVSKVGLGVGLFYIVFLGILLMTLNLLVGEVVALQKASFSWLVWRGSIWASGRLFHDCLELFNGIRHFSCLYYWRRQHFGKCFWRIHFAGAFCFLSWEALWLWLVWRQSKPRNWF